VFKAHDIESAEEKSGGTSKRWSEKEQPIKFKKVDHRGYTINYLSMKGLFKVLFENSLIVTTSHIIRS